MLFAKKAFTARPERMLARLRAMAGACPAPDLDTARSWLVFAGQLEQAVSDADADARASHQTDRAAELFLAVLRGTDSAPRHRELLAALDSYDAETGTAEVRIPEGFAWYALYPEAYALTAERWKAAAWRGGPVLVVGLRSIGTTLSAVVRAALSSGGVPADRITLRPTGGPFDRKTRLPAAIGRPVAAIIVDEGPGLSGSSMAGVADALVEHGIAPEAISFFPGHLRGPGAMAGAAARRWWNKVHCWSDVVPQEIGRGEAHVVWRFAGFAAVSEELDSLASVKRERQERLASIDLACRTIGPRHGWIGMIEDGEPLSRDALSSSLVRGTLAPYVAAAALPSLGSAALREAVARVAAALPASHATDATERVATSCERLPVAGDGRLAPGEWLRRRDGRILKRDATGTDCEHSWAGRQSILWDVAGACCEWRLEDAMRRDLLQVLRDAHGILAEPLALTFHEAGYCALQAARAEHGGDTAEARHFAALRDAALRRMEVLR